ncbi:alginate lyase-domain-containing protein [Naematelia encephala]|uniref:Alginate lyase-domain-containing protein n=1 Tax=Naematelia encephala TaxID=71784 RepID=A0A1Y2BHN5_9TREE|nr:alginate lyase-domain-containing protein [Naematelia encephala]
MPSLATILRALTLTLTFLAAPCKAVGITSYANMFFEPSDVINSTWFENSQWAQEMAISWTRKLALNGPWSVTNKTVMAKSGDVHDYLSYAVYYWPNCTSVGNTTALTSEEVWDECPYYRRDGVFNPDIHVVEDNEAMANLTDSVYLAAMAYIGTGDSAYSQHINDAMHTFFVNNATRMNPSIDYSQVIRGPGTQGGRRQGVLDMRGLAKAVSGVLVLRELEAPEWTDETDQGFVQWATDMVTWLETDDLALAEKAASNNHGTFYYNQLCALYALLGENDKAISALNEFYNSTFPGQINANGDQPLETARTRPYHYRAYNLAALTTNARIGDYVGLSPSGWNRTTTSGATMFDALKFAMAQNASTTNEDAEINQLNPTIAAVASKFGDPDGAYAAFLKASDPYYPGQPYFALNAGVSDSGIRQGLLRTTYGAVPAQPTKGSSWGYKRHERSRRRL